MFDVKPRMEEIVICFCRNFGVSLLVLCLVAGVVSKQSYAQDASVSLSTPESKPADSSLSLSGTVVNSLTGEPIRRAVVTLTRGQTNVSTLSDTSGGFEFEGLSQGRAVLSAVRPGFGIRYAGFFGTTVNVSRTSPPVLLKLDPTGAVVGRLTSRDGQPLEGYSLRLVSKMSIEGTLRWSYQPYQSSTDDNGNFRIANVPPNTYYLEVTQNQGTTTLSQRGVPNPREQAYAEVFYPGVPDLAAASPIAVGGGSEVEADFSLSAEPLYQISGAVSPEENFVSLVFSRKAGDGNDFVETTATQDGRFQIKLLPGAYNVKGSTATGTQLSAYGVTVSSDNSNMHLALNPVPVIQVEVRREKSSASPTPEASDQPGAVNINLQLTPATGLRQNSYWWSPTQSNGIQAVDPGAYVVHANINQGPWWLKSLHSGNVDLLSDDLTVADGAQPLPIEITLQDDAGSVQGTVSPHDDTIPATVLLIQPHGKRNLVMVSAAFQGKFAFDSVPPGEHLALALDGSGRLDYLNPDVLNPYLSGAQRVTVTPHGTINVNLSPSPIER
jgi:hypothetical protein